MITTLKELRTYFFLWNIVARFIYFIIFVYVNMQRTVAGKVLYIHSFI